ILSPSEWKLVEGLYKILNPFVWFTKEMEGNTRPLIHEVIPLIDRINMHLEAVVDNISQDDLLRISAKRGLMILDKYYAKTDDSLVYRSAMLMHPSYKTAYFKTAGWPDGWVTAAKESLIKHWETYYK
ncbi:hypothetical protein K435DRAFT_620982, partial [Dendrothele bispora CBS 962.96]